MNSRNIIGSLCGLAGGIVGAVLGYFVFRWIAGQGFYALAVPGTLLGLGWGLASRHRSNFDAAICGILALGLGVFSEWKFAPFIADGSFSFFLKHLHQLKPITWIMIGVGVAAAVWLGAGRGPRDGVTQDI
ncbi:MAG: hypothetical protein K8T25_02485 [Planctomycetia bacterium]|nr:hypothetical protein [Planctomycetia bacterium]